MTFQGFFFTFSVVIRYSFRQGEEAQIQERNPGCSDAMKPEASTFYMRILFLTSDMEADRC